MSLSVRENSLNGALLEKVITNNDLGGLSPVEKVQHIKNVCESLGLNPLTKPIQLLKFQGKEIAYFTKDATEQLRKLHDISIKIRDNKIQEGIYIVLVDATTPEGRSDSATGAINIKGLIGDALCNAILKAETKAKRRVTLSICGLGFTDESEIDTMRGAKKIDIHAPIETVNARVIDDNSDTDDMDFECDISRIEKANNMDELEEAFRNAYKFWSQKKDKDRLKKIMDMKDIRKSEFAEIKVTKELDTVDVETGEVK